MSTPRYFARHPLGSIYAKFFLLAADGRTVVRTQLSRPDGIEVQEPAHVRFRKPQPIVVTPARRREINPPVVAQHKHCRRCGETKLRAEFYTRATGGAVAWCISCMNTYKRARRSATKGTG